MPVFNCSTTNILSFCNTSASNSPAEIALCSVVKAELLFGAYRSGRVEANLQRLKIFFEPLQNLLFDDECADHYARIRADLHTRGQLIGGNDMLIAAIARAHNATLVTHNTGEFSRVVGLRLEDWDEIRTPIFTVNVDFCWVLLSLYPIYKL
jgi:tRNA(fMet)-specific endonuclease VapC